MVLYFRQKVMFAWCSNLYKQMIGITKAWNKSHIPKSNNFFLNSEYPVLLFENMLYYSFKRPMLSAATLKIMKSTQIFFPSDYWQPNVNLLRFFKDHRILLSTFLFPMAHISSSMLLWMGFILTTALK